MSYGSWGIVLTVTIRIDGQGEVPSNVFGFIRDLTGLGLINFIEKEGNIRGKTRTDYSINKRWFYLKKANIFFLHNLFSFSLSILHCLEIFYCKTYFNSANIYLFWGYSKSWKSNKMIRDWTEVCQYISVIMISKPWGVP